MRPLLNEVRRARSPKLQKTLWTRFKQLYSSSSSLINYIQKNWFNKEGRLEKWAFFRREDEQVVTTNNWIESWHARLKADHLDGDRNPRVDWLVFLLQDRVDREFRFAYLKTKRGFQPIPWRKEDEERKRKADKVSFDEAQRKINYNKDQPCHDERLRISMQSLDPDTSITYYTLVVVARSRQLLSCSCPDFTRRRPLPCKHLFLAERVIHDLWLSRFIRPSVSADAIEARTDDHNDGLNDSDNANDDSNNANDDTNNNMDSNTDIFEQDSLRDQLALLSPQVYTQLEYERARRVKEVRHRRKKQRKERL